MNSLIIFSLAVCSLAVAFPQQDPAAAPPAQPVQILKQDSTIDSTGYSFDFDTSDGTSRQEKGELKDVGNNETLTVSGQYSYLDPQGEKHSVTFIADENGFQPQIHAGDAAAQPQVQGDQQAAQYQYQGDQSASQPQA